MKAWSAVGVSVARAAGVSLAAAAAVSVGAASVTSGTGVSVSAVIGVASSPGSNVGVASGDSALHASAARVRLSKGSRYQRLFFMATSKREILARLQHVHHGVTVRLYPLGPGVRILLDQRPGIVVNRDVVPRPDQLGGAQRIVRPHSEIIADGQYGQRDALIADEPHVAEQPR